MIEKNETLFKTSDGALEVLATANEAAYTKALKALVPLLHEPPYSIRAVSFAEASRAFGKHSRQAARRRAGGDEEEGYEEDDDL